MKHPLRSQLPCVFRRDLRETRVAPPRIVAVIGKPVFAARLHRQIARADVNHGRHRTIGICPAEAKQKRVPIVRTRAKFRAILILPVFVIIPDAAEDNASFGDWRAFGVPFAESDACHRNSRGRSPKLPPFCPHSARPYHVSVTSAARLGLCIALLFAFAPDAPRPVQRQGSRYFLPAAWAVTVGRERRRARAQHRHRCARSTPI